MAIEVQVSSVTALVTGEPREKKVHQGSGDRRVAGRATDAEERPLSTVSAPVVVEPLGLSGEVTLQLSDLQATGLVPGVSIRVEESTTARLTGGDYETIRATVTGARGIPRGQWLEWVASARPVNASDSRAA
jgi:hypothetical protein